MKKYFIALLILLTFILAACSPASQSSSAMEGDTMMEGDHSGSVLGGTTTQYVDVTQEYYDKAIAEDKTIVLNFYANWCPLCQVEQTVIIDFVGTLDDENLVVFRVNYRDSDATSFEQQLAREFGIVAQGSKIFIKGGQVVHKTIGHWNAAQYQDEFDLYV